MLELASPSCSHCDLELTAVSGARRGVILLLAFVGRVALLLSALGTGARWHSGRGLASLRACAGSASTAWAACLHCGLAGIFVYVLYDMSSIGEH